MGKRIRSTERCPICDLAYEKFRSIAVPSFQEAYEIKIQSSREAHANGDYSVNATRGTTLGIMRHCKQAAWKVHIYECCMEKQIEEQEALEIDKPFWQD